jgi:CBS domain-containing protein
MTRLRDIMTREVISVSPDLSIRDAMSLLSSRHISGAPVVEGTSIIGVVTSNDLMAFAAELPGSPTERAVDNTDYDDTRTRNVDSPDVDPEPPANFFTELWDDAGADVTVRFSSINGAEWNVLDEHTVEEAMTRAPICAVPAETTLPAAAEFMRHHSIHRVLVTDEGKFVGIVTSTDIANAVAEHKVRDREFIFGKESHFTGQRAGKAQHPETTLGARLKPAEERDGPAAPTTGLKDPGKTSS